MGVRKEWRVISGDAPDSNTSAVLGDAQSGMENWVLTNISCTISGQVGGTLDLYLQRFDDGLGVWVDWVHFAQVAAGASDVTYMIPGTVAAADIYTVGVGTTVALAADAYTGGHQGSQVRAYAVCGTGTSTGATVTCSLLGTLS